MVHVSVDELPDGTSLGLAVNWLITGLASAGSPVTVTSAVAVPPGLVAVSVYFVVTAGVTSTQLPICAPTPWSMVSSEVLVTVHASVAFSPAWMVSGVVVNEVISGSGDDALEHATASASSGRRSLRITVCLRA